jgi:uncharacterized protein YheU (UPF0270 family)
VQVRIEDEAAARQALADVLALEEGTEVGEGEDSLEQA